MWAYRRSQSRIPFIRAYRFRYRVVEDVDDVPVLPPHIHYPGLDRPDFELAFVRWLASRRRGRKRCGPERSRARRALSRGP